MFAPCLFAVRVALSIIVVAVFALVYLVALALEAPDPRTAPTQKAVLPDSSKGNMSDLDPAFGAADLSAPVTDRSLQDSFAR